ncbi:DNA adenine methylase [[Actinomadura] parvosata]|uniref:DNA adenine methylase n=1 Tax=[Actinomadura] parvosata TaxID=1955412 RepID=UPI0009ADDE24|nr:DNA adenine methylase [Nonomuraea sp. ATCC 55076]
MTMLNPDAALTQRGISPGQSPLHIRDMPRAVRDVLDIRDSVTIPSRHLSPLRYPGAKSGLSKVIGELVESASQSIGRPSLFVEPFAGGASTSLSLASQGLVDRVLLADADPLVARFWQVAASETEWLIDRMHDEPVTLERWDFWRAWQPRSKDDRDVAVKCLFLNRTTFSGILHGRAGPIGGRKQESAYKIDCRFNKEALAERLRYIGELYRSNRIVDVWCKDWKDTLEDVAEWYPQLLPDRVISYIDPPYINKSSKLYGHSFDPAGGYSSSDGSWENDTAHYQLASYLRHNAQNRWILSYDNHPALTTNPELYSTSRMTPTKESTRLLRVRAWRISKRLVDLHYSVSSRFRGRRKELLLTTLPPTRVPLNEQFMPLEFNEDS